MEVPSDEEMSEMYYKALEEISALVEEPIRVALNRFVPPENMPPRIVAVVVAHALTGYGIQIAKNNGVPSDTITQAVEMAKELLDEPAPEDT